jgi:hypothetical protein
MISTCPTAVDCNQDNAQKYNNRGHNQSKQQQQQNKIHNNNKKQTPNNNHHPSSRTFEFFVPNVGTNNATAHSWWRPNDLSTRSPPRFGQWP